MTTQQITLLGIFVPIITTAMISCERLIKHYDLDCRASAVWDENEEIPPERAAKF